MNRDGANFRRQRCLESAWNLLPLDGRTRLTGIVRSEHPESSSILHEEPLLAGFLGGQLHFSSLRHERHGNARNARRQGYLCEGRRRHFAAALRRRRAGAPPWEGCCLRAPSADTFDRCPAQFARVCEARPRSSPADPPPWSPTIVPSVAAPRPTAVHWGYGGPNRRSVYSRKELPEARTDTCLFGCPRALDRLEHYSVCEQLRRGASPLCSPLSPGLVDPPMGCRGRPCV